MSDGVSLRQLSQRFTGKGRVEAILTRTSRHGAVEMLQQAHAEPGRGLLGDHRADALRQGAQARKRELTLIQSEHLDMLAQWCAVPALQPAQLRRNLVVAGINLLAMRCPFPDQWIEWSIGDTVRIEVTGSCDPCSRMEQVLGRGGYNAMRGHGGVTARIVSGGVLRVGDPVDLVAVHQRACGRGD